MTLWRMGLVLVAAGILGGCSTTNFRMELTTPGAADSNRERVCGHDSGLKLFGITFASEADSEVASREALAKANGASYLVGMNVAWHKFHLSPVLEWSSVEVSGQPPE